MKNSKNPSGPGFIFLLLVFLMALLSVSDETPGGWQELWGPGEAHAQKMSRPGTGAAPFRVVPENSPTEDKTLSPYFFVKSDNPETDQLPLKSTFVEVDIAGVIADVRVTQVYKNAGQKTLEAIYIFPASTRAAVYGMKMTIGERTITAQISKREEARQVYEQAKQQGKSASLLEQQRPNVFQMNVANILPGDEIRTELRYTELLTPSEGIYEFVYPTVVGPRYSNQPAAEAPASERWVENPYLHEKAKTPYTFDITTHLATGLPLQQVTCATHQVDIKYEDPSRATVKLASSEEFGGNRDFILKYRLSGDRIESGLLLYEGKDENYFLLMMEPPKRVKPEQIPGREYIFIVDVSGSMHGFPLDISKLLLSDLIGNLKPTDTFNVLLFAGGSQLLAEESLPATPENIRRALDLIDHQRGGGGTELLPAMRRALSLPRREGTARTFVIATDGYVTVEAQTFDLIRKELGHSNFFAFGIGSSVNRFLIEGMAHAGQGEPFVITKPDEAPAKAERFRQYVQTPLLTQIRLDYGSFGAYQTEPAGVPDVFAERPVIVFGKWRGQPAGTITLRGITGNQPYEKTIDVGGVKPLASNSALRYLWARSRIRELADYNQLQPQDERVAEITNLALKYSLLSPYTSFVAVDSIVRRKDGSFTTVKQPLPLPQGVSDYAVGGAAPAATLSSARGGLSALAAPPMRHSPGVPRREQFVAEEAKSAAPDKELSDSNNRSRLNLRIGKLVVGLGLSEEAVQRSIQSQLEKTQECCRALDRGKAGKEIKVRWIIDSEGKVAKVELVSDRIKSKDFWRCLLEQIKNWRFSSPAGKKVSAVTVSFVLDAKGQ